MVTDTSRQPTFAQYIPELFYFEEENNNLLCSSFSGLPLVRYDLKDYGGLKSMRGLSQDLANAGVDVVKLSRQNGIDDKIWNLPFVYVYERNDFSVSYFAFQIYPETVRRALQTVSMEKSLTGKFTMQVLYDENGQQILEINVEMKHAITEDDKLHKQVLELIVKKLLDESSEFREVHKLYGDQIFPRLVFWPYEDETFFRTGVKQKWINKL